MAGVRVKRQLELIRELRSRLQVSRPADATVGDDVPVYR